MRLKTGSVYIYKNQSYIYIIDCKKQSGRLRYTGAKIGQDGTIGKRFKFKAERGAYKEASEYTVHIQVKLPKKDYEKVKFDSLVSRASDIIQDHLKSGNRVTSKKQRHDIAQLAVACIALHNKDLGRGYNLRDFAKGLRFKDYKKLYRWVIDFYKKYYTLDKFEIALPKAANSTIIGNFRRLNQFWDALYGFNAEFNEMLETNYKAYSKEMNRRGLSL